MNKLNITIEGATATGKTRVGLLIEELLTLHGFNVEFDNTDEYSDQQIEQMKITLPEANKTISTNTEISIKQKQSPREHQL